MKKIFQIFIIVCGSLLMNSCYYDNEDDFIIETPEIPEGQEVKYGVDIQPIWNSNCISCHNASNNLDLRVDISYNELVPDYVIKGNADDSPLYIKLQNGAHDGRANATQMKLIESWIDRGAENN